MPNMSDKLLGSAMSVGSSKPKAASSKNSSEDEQRKAKRIQHSLQMAKEL